MLEWVAIPFPGGSSWPGARAWVSPTPLSWSPGRPSGSRGDRDRGHGGGGDGLVAVAQNYDRFSLLWSEKEKFISKSFPKQIETTESMKQVFLFS